MPGGAVITGGGAVGAATGEGITTGGPPGVVAGEGGITGGTVAVGTAGIEGGTTTVAGGALVAESRLVEVLGGRTVRLGKVASAGGMAGGAWVTCGAEGLVFPARASRRAWRRAASRAASAVDPGVASGAPGCAQETAHVRSRASKVVFTVVLGLRMIYWWTRRVLGLEWRECLRALPLESSTSRQEREI